MAQLKNIALDIKNILIEEEKLTTFDKSYKISLSIFGQQMSENVFIAISSIFTAVIETGLISQDENDINEMRKYLLLSSCSALILNKFVLYYLRSIKYKYRDMLNPEEK